MRLKLIIEQYQYCRAGGYDNRVHEIRAEVIFAPHIGEVAPQQREFRNRPRLVREKLFIVLERIEQCPKQRIQYGDTPDEENRIKENSDDGFFIVPFIIILLS